MGLRCLLGHDFSEPEVERERQEDGDEVVTTVREVKTCARCGETQVVSENTEVTTMEQLTDQATTAGVEGARRESPSGERRDPADRGAAGPARKPTEPGADGASADASTDPSADATAGVGPAADSDAEAPGIDRDSAIDPDADDAEILDDPDPADAGTGASGGPRPDRTERDAGDDEGAELLDETGAAPAGVDDEVAPDDAPDEPTSVDAETDDGVILDDDSEAGDDRGRGAWPTVEEGSDAGDASRAWPEQAGDDEGFSAEVGDGADSGIEYGGGLTPESVDSADADTEYVETPDADTEYVETPDADTEYVETPDADSTSAPAESPSGPAAGSGASVDAGSEITREGSPDLEPTVGDADTEYFCPECGMTVDAVGNSMRAGDICPECKRGYVDERHR